MLVAFIAFSKAYMTRWTRENCGVRCLDKLGINGKFLQILQALYEGTSCRVRVGDKHSEEFQINVGLHQGCVLSPLLLSLYAERRKL